LGTLFALRAQADKMSAIRHLSFHFLENAKEKSKSDSIRLWRPSPLALPTSQGQFLCLGHFFYKKGLQIGTGSV
jgi:hypothetical protein